MPTYLCHGFRWHRRAIRVYIVVQNLDDGTPEWIITRGSPECLIESFYNLFDFLPDCTFPPSARTRARTRSAPPPPFSTRGASQQRPDSTATDDSASLRTSASRRSKSRSRSRSRSRTRRPPALHQQRSQSALSTRGRDNTQSQQPGASSSGRQSSNSSRKRANRPQPNISLPYRGGAPAASAAPPPVPTHRTISFSAAPEDPIQAQAWSPITLLEEYDPSNLNEVSQPHAYVADHVVRIDSAVSVVEEIQRYERSVRHAPVPPVTGSSSDEMLCKQQRRRGGPGGRGGWFERLRDELQRDEEIRWWVVVNGDEERAWNGGGGIVEEGSSVATESVLGEDEDGVSVAGQPVMDGARMAHAAYSQQCRVWEEQDREAREARKQERRSRERKPIPRTMPPPPPPPPAPVLHTQLSMEQLSGQETPKTPGSGLRKLFSRGGRPDDATTP